jgi:hypothetical protein
MAHPPLTEEAETMDDPSVLASERSCEVCARPLSAESRRAMVTLVALTLTPHFVYASCLTAFQRHTPGTVASVLEYSLDQVRYYRPEQGGVMAARRRQAGPSFEKIADIAWETWGHASRVEALLLDVRMLRHDDVPDAKKIELALQRDVAERLTARAIREGKNIEAIVTEILEAEARRR